MKFRISLFATILLVGIFTLNTSARPVSANPLASDEQSAEVRDVNENLESEEATLGGGSDRSTTPVDNKFSTFKQMANSARTIYSFVKAHNWPEASRHMASIQTMTESLKANSRISKTELARFNSLIMPLQNLITARQYSAMDTANQLAMIATQLAISSEPQIPKAVAMLDYYSRELEIWSERGNPARLKAVANQIQQTWATLRSEIQSHAAPRQVQTFDDTLFSLVQTATSPTEYSLLAASLLAEVNNLQHLFQLVV